MSDSNLEVSKANRTNEMSEINDLTAKPSFLGRSANQVTNFRFDEINKIEDYLNAEIKERKDIVKKISTYIVAFYYADKNFYYPICIVCHFKYCVRCNGCWNTVGIAGASLTVIFTVTTGVVKKKNKYREKKEEET